MQIARAAKEKCTSRVVATPGINMKYDPLKWLNKDKTHKKNMR
jgi:hypothetical protein